MNTWQQIKTTMKDPQTPRSVTILYLREMGKLKRDHRD